MNGFDLLLSAVNLLAALCCTLLWNQIKKMEILIERTKDDLAEYKLSVMRDYATDRDLQAIIEKCTKSYNDVFNILEALRREVRSMSENFRDRLEKKQDRRGQHDQ